MIKQRILYWLALPFILPACGHNHVQLMFPIQSASAEYYECKLAQDAKPEARAPQCTRVTEIDPARENQASTRHIDVPRCENSEHYYRITILNADTSEPTALVRCGQDAVLHTEE